MNWGNIIQPITGPNEYHYDIAMKKEVGRGWWKTCVSLKVWSQAHQHRQQLEVVRKANSQIPPSTYCICEWGSSNSFLVSPPERLPFGNNNCRSFLITGMMPTWEIFQPVWLKMLFHPCVFFQYMKLSHILQMGLRIHFTLKIGTKPELQA